MVIEISVVHVAVAALYGAAGFCIFLMLLNRTIMLVEDSRFKTPLMLVVFMLLVGGSFMAGLVYGSLPWLLIPAAVLLLVAAGEVGRFIIRRRCAGSLPVDTVPHRVVLKSPVTTMDLVVHRYEVPHPKWRGAPLRVVHLTDLHVNPGLQQEYFERVMDAAVEAKPDIAVFTGDYISRVDGLPGLRRILRPIGRLGTYAVLGNHDYWVDPGAVGTVIRECGLCLLAGESVDLSVGGNKVIISGCDSPWGPGRELDPAEGSDALRLLLSHTADNVYRVSGTADIMFSGHYHAGQIRIPVLGSVVIPSLYGRRFDHGHFVVNGTHLFVASGIGAANPALRIYCQPDIFVVDVVQP